MQTEKEQKQNFEEYFNRKLTHDEVFIVEWLYASFEKEIKNLKEENEASEKNYLWSSNKLNVDA